MTVCKPPCDGLTELYFPDHGERPEALQERLDLCRRICATCPLILACSIHAHRDREWGIWAGRMHWGADRTPNEQRTRRKGQQPMTRSPFGNTGGFANPNPRTLTPCPRCKRLRDASRKGPCGLCLTHRTRKDDQE